ncbi:MAG: Asp23/Gls24 family envelope stress response protein [Eubacteriales bacterium]|nr:Asp23/Gls24 family envelope stress response protein [Eubacteriales bacterium]MDD4324156.1 Asp23/Gls24 family envelope stress response protein [Eubacteriales bacterium]
MSEERRHVSIKGEQTMSRGFIAQYAAEATLATEGVASLDRSVVANIKEVIGLEHEGMGVRVSFRKEDADDVIITVYPIIDFGYVLPEVAWSIQERVKRDVESYTGLSVDAVNVHVVDIISEDTEFPSADNSAETLTSELTD